MTPRQQAVAVGDKYYFTGKPCPVGHIAKRKTSNGECADCARVRLKKWRDRHPEAVKKHNDTQHLLHAAELSTRSKRFCEQNKDKVKKWSKRYQQKNLHIFAANNAKRKATKLKATPKWLSKEDRWLITEIYDLCRRRTFATGVPWQVDHIVPLQSKDVCGLHVPWNLRVILGKENRAKGNKLC